MRKIVYLVEQPMDERNYDRFGIQTWMDRGWEVEVWDLTASVRPAVWRNFIAAGNKLRQFAGYYPIASRRDLEFRYTEHPRAEYFVDLTENYYYSMRVKRRLLKTGAKMILFTGIASMPSLGDEGERGLLRKARRKVRKAIEFGPAMLREMLFQRLFRGFAARMIRPSLVVVSGERTIRSTRPRRGQEIVRAHNLDYDHYLKIAKSTGVAMGNYGVFLDQDLCFHPEYAQLNLRPYVTPERYFPTLCRGLRKISSALGADMRIAAHPRASYDRRGTDYFDGLPVRKGVTAELISQCKFVVCHQTTSLQLAVLFRKPLIFVTTDELNVSLFANVGGKFASALGKSIVNLDGDLDRVDWEQELVIDSGKYDEYRNEYIKTDGSPELQSWEIVIDSIEGGAKRSSHTLPDLAAVGSGK